MRLVSQRSACAATVAPAARIWRPPWGARRAAVAESAPMTCPHRPPCPGCPRFGEPGIPPTGRDALAALASANGLPPPVVVEGDLTGYRHRARLAVRGRAASPKVGIF